MLLAVYGTLRRGENLEDYLQGAELKETLEVKGYDMYSLGSYPYIVRGEGTITLEVYDVTPEAFIMTGAMEIRAGYGIETVPTSEGPAYLFVLKDKTHQAFRATGAGELIEGDWVKYWKKRRENYANTTG